MDAQINPIQALSEAFDTLKVENAALQESMAEVRAQFALEDKGWQTILGVNVGDQTDGLSLDELHDIADVISPRVVAGALPKRAVDLHAGFVFGRGMYIEGTEKPSGRGAIPKARRVYADPENQASVFSDTAHEELQRERFISGNVLVAVNTKTNKVNRIPFKQIKGMRLDPEFPEKIIAWLREWDTQDGSKNSTRRQWYYSKQYSGPRKKSFSDGAGGTIPVAQDTTVVDLRANRQVGHVLGVPDGVAGIHWAEAYTQAMKHGMVVTESMAKILYKVTSATPRGVQSAGVKVAGANGVGNTASMTNGQDLQAVSTAGRSYSFEALNPLAGLAALAWNVSVMDLLNSAAASGSSYGSASALVPGNRNAMLLMQSEWGTFFKDIFEVLGEGRPSITFEPFEAPDKYREVQAITLGAIALSDEEYRMKILDALDIVGDASAIPDLLKARGEAPEGSAAGVQQASPGQGRPNPSGAAGSTDSNDIQDDTVSGSE